VAFDPNYHAEVDTIANISQTGFEQMTDAAAFVMGSYAMDPGFRARFDGAVSARRGAKAARKSDRLGRHPQR